GAAGVGASPRRLEPRPGPGSLTGGSVGRLPRARSARSAHRHRDGAVPDGSRGPGPAARHRATRPGRAYPTGWYHHRWWRWPVSGIEVTGAMLRQLRLQARLGLRAVARRGLSRISDSHLSRVERGDRPVTPAVVAVYEKALGVRIDQALLAGVGSCDTADTRDPAVLVAVRKAYLTELATVAIGGPAGELATRLGQPAQGL